MAFNYASIMSKCRDLDAGLKQDNCYLGWGGLYYYKSSWSGEIYRYELLDSIRDIKIAKELYLAAGFAGIR